VQPIMRGYLANLEEELRKRGFAGDLLVAGSNGGALSIPSALAKPVHTLESGPAAGVVGCAALFGDSSQGQFIAFDMGGTTAKCCLVERAFPVFIAALLVPSAYGALLRFMLFGTLVGSATGPLLMGEQGAAGPNNITVSVLGTRSAIRGVGHCVMVCSPAAPPNRSVARTASSQLAGCCTEFCAKAARHVR
jgi:hypothetical protein